MKKNFIKNAAGKVGEKMTVLPGYFAPLDKRKFSVIAAELILALFVFLFAFLRSWTENVFTPDGIKSGVNGIYLAYSVITLAASAGMLALTELSRRAKLGTVFFLIPAAVQSVGFLLYMIYSLLNAGGYYMCVEALFLVLFIIVIAAFFFTLLGRANPKKAAAVIFSLAAAALFSGFVPAIAQSETVMFCIKEYAPISVLFALLGVLSLGVDDKWIETNKVDTDA